MLPLSDTDAMGPPADMPEPRLLDPAALANLIDREHEAIVAQWRAAVAQTKHTRQGDILTELVPLFLNQLTHGLRGGGGSLAAQGLGSQLYLRGVKVADVFREFGILRDCILDTVEAQQLQLSCTSFKAMARSLYEGATQSATEYAAERERAQADAEQCVQLALQAAKLATWELNPHTGATTFRDSGLDLPKKGRDLMRDVHPTDRDVLETALACAMDPTGSGAYDAVFRIPNTAHTGKRWLHAHGQMVFDDTGYPVRLVGTVQDITEHKLLEEETERRARFLHELLGIVSHDLRNPIGGIILTADLLAQHVEAHTLQARQIGRIQNAANRAHRLICDLLDFTVARMGEGIPVRPRPTDLHDLVRQVIDEQQAAHPERQLVLQQHGDCRGNWDEERLAQVVANLVGNAIQHGAPDTAIAVKLDGYQDEVTLAVHNAGPPIPSMALPQLFEPLKRGPGVRTGGRSIGLGLYIVREITEAHGGRVRVTSTHDAGTTFYVHLPKQAGMPAAPERSESPLH